MIEHIYFLNEKNIIPIDIHELDDIGFSIISENKIKNLSIFIEDYNINFDCQESDDGYIYNIKSEKYFQEFFGNSIVTFNIDDENYSLFFNVKWNKIELYQIKEMIDYVFKKNELIIRLCLSKTTMGVGVNENKKSDPETIISAAEKTLEKINSYKNNFHRLSHSKIVNNKSVSPPSENNFYDPFDLLANLDELSICSENESVVINGQKYSIKNIPSINLIESKKTKENSIIIGGLYSILHKINTLKKNIFKNNVGIKSYDDEYKETISLDEALAFISYDNMNLRCVNIIKKCEYLIIFFEKKLGFVYQGELKPIFNSFVRHNKMYKEIFSELRYWYFLGLPNLDGVNYLIKLRSLSKLYEYFTLFNIVETLEKNNWKIVSILENAECITFMKDNNKINIYYEKRISPYTEYVKHNEIIDISKKTLAQIKNNEFWYRPDFTLEIINNHDNGFIILDSKYSSKNNIKKYHIKNLIDKYLINLRVFNKHKNSIVNNKIFSIYAIFPERNDKNKNVISYWSNKIENVKNYPLIGMKLLSPGFDSNFDLFLIKHLNDCFKEIE